MFIKYKTCLTYNTSCYIIIYMRCSFWQQAENPAKKHQNKKNAQNSGKFQNLKNKTLLLGGFTRENLLIKSKFY